MARRTKPERVLGPYRHYRRWRVLLVSVGGEKTVTDYESEEKARQVVRSVRRELAKGGDRTVLEARDKYEVFMREDKGNKQRSISATVWRLGSSSTRRISSSTSSRPRAARATTKPCGRARGRRRSGRWRWTRIGTSWPRRSRSSAGVWGIGGSRAIRSRR